MCTFIHCRKVFSETKLQKTKKPDLCTGFFKKFLSDNSVLKYFFDDYLSFAIDSISRLNNFNFIDINKSIKDRFDNIEFYADYCHLTPDANKIVADIISEEISEVLIQKSLVETE